jgi:chorismate mutase
MSIRGVRGAIQATDDETQAILKATRQLLLAIMESNPTLYVEDIASVIFTVTPDLKATFPAFATRSLKGWKHVPLLCTSEIPVPQGLPRCIRILLHWNTSLAQDEIHHVYLGAAASLRPDLADIETDEIALEEPANGRLPATR